MVTMTWKVYGVNGHRQKQSFGKSESNNWSFDGSTRLVEIIREDQTGTNEYVIIRITRDTEDDCLAEFEGQLSDGIFENSRVGWHELISIKEV